MFLWQITLLTKRNFSKREVVEEVTSDDETNDQGVIDL